MIDKLRENCKGVRSEFSGYWKRYGGWSCLITSPFFLAAWVLTLLCAPYWWNGNWWDLSATVIPAVLGFSIAAFALLLSLGDDSFKLRFGQIRVEGKQSTLTNIATSFFHFIVIQAVALAIAFVGGARIMSAVLSMAPEGSLAPWANFVFIAVAKGFRAVGFFFLAYSLMSALAAALSIYRMALIYSTHATKELRRRAEAEAKQAAQAAQAAPP